MSFFQNPFLEEFRGNWVLGDRHQSLVFDCPANNGRGTDSVTAWKEGPYDLSVNDADGNPRANLTIVYTVDFMNWAELSIDVSGATASSTTPEEVITALNANDNFTGFFTANYEHKFPTGTLRVFIKQKLGSARLKFYIKNGGAEESIRFNHKAGVKELPEYFLRHSAGSNASGVPYNRVFPDGVNQLVYLDVSGWVAEGDTVAGDVVYHAVNNKGITLELDPANPQADYEMLTGRSGLFAFHKNAVDASSRITESIQYHAGAQVGDLAKKITYTYTGAQTSPDQMTEEPYTLTSADLVTP